MTTQNRSRLFGLGLSIVGLVVLSVIPRAGSQEAQKRGTPLKDVCPKDWTHHHCGHGIRVCIPPEIQKKYDLAADQNARGTQWDIDCYDDSGYYYSQVLPEEWTHATFQQIGYIRASGWHYNYFVRVVMVDSSMIDPRIFENGYRWLAFEKMRSAIHRDGDEAAMQDGEHSFNAVCCLISRTPEQFGRSLPPPKPGAKEVCPVSWKRYSCDFVRLCVSPAVTRQYDLEKSKEFGYARCKASDRIVSEEDTQYSPHDVGLAAGLVLVPPRYVRVVELDSPDIFEGDIEEAIERLVLVPMQPNDLIEYDRGRAEGQAKFDDLLQKSGKVAQEKNAHP